MNERRFDEVTQIGTKYIAIEHTVGTDISTSFELQLSLVILNQSK